MTLTEYINQTDPARHPRVILRKGEYRIIKTTRSGPDIHREISIPEIWEKYGVDGYIQRNDEATLLTADANGNPSFFSCFYLEEPNATEYCQCEQPAKVHHRNACWRCKRELKPQIPTPQ